MQSDSVRVQPKSDPWSCAPSLVIDWRTPIFGWAKQVLPKVTLQNVSRLHIPPDSILSPLEGTAFYKQSLHRFIPTRCWLENTQKHARAWLHWPVSVQCKYLLGKPNYKSPPTRATISSTSKRSARSSNWVRS